MFKHPVRILGTRILAAGDRYRNQIRSTIIKLKITNPVAFKQALGERRVEGVHV